MVIDIVKITKCFISIKKNEDEFIFLAIFLSIFVAVILSQHD